MNLPVKIRRDWHYYAFAIGLIFILNGVVGLLGFEAKGWQTYAVGLVTWVISFWLAGKKLKTPNKNITGRLNITLWFSVRYPQRDAPAPAQSNA